MTLFPWRITITRRDDAETRLNRDDDAETRLNKEFMGQHEKNSPTHVRKFQERLNDLVKQPRDSSDPSLKDHVDVQLKIEELILKSRIAEHTKWQVYGPGLIALATGLLGLIIGYISRPK